MSSVTWRYLAGDTAIFAIEFALVNNQLDDWMVDADERMSWGSVTVWIRGINVCEQTVQGETLQAAHWYLLPVAEWLVEQWDPLLHEERLPLSDTSPDAARAYASAALLAEHDQKGHLHDPERIQDYYMRHGLRASAPGGLLPDLYVRRYGDMIEFSTGVEPIAGADWGLIFSQEMTATRVPVESVTDTLSEILQAFAKVMLKRDPNNYRYLEFHANVNALKDSHREHVRFAWLSGAGDRIEDFNQLWSQVSSAIPENLQEAFRSFATTREVDGGLAVLSAPATLLFGCLAPDVSSDDVIDIYKALVAQRDVAAPVSDNLHLLGEQVFSSWNLAGMSPGEEGSVYGQEAWNRLVGHDDMAEVDIESVLKSLDVMVGQIGLRDRDVRAISMISSLKTAHILVNENFRRGQARHVRRFTLAHELGHLLLDQGRAVRMAVASGPWAPVDIEQRANAFAAAFLVPLPLLNRLNTSHEELLDVGSIRSLASELGVSVAALVNRLQNLNRISRMDAEILRAEMIDRA